MPELANRSALIVGDDEIGRGIAARFVRAGATAAISGDFIALASLDVLVVNTLGAADPALLENIGRAQMLQRLDRVAAAAEAMRQALPLLRARGGGRIILVGQRYGDNVSEGLGAYNAAAWSLVGLMRTAAVEWGQYGVATNLLIPFADTAELRAAHARRPKIIGLLLGQIPLRRAGDPVEDIGGAALFLASEDAAFVNGQVVYADGGQHVAGPVLNPIRFAT